MLLFTAWLGTALSHYAIMSRYGFIRKWLLSWGNALVKLMFPGHFAMIIFELDCLNHCEYGQPLNNNGIFAASIMHWYTEGSTVNTGR